MAREWRSTAVGLLLALLLVLGGSAYSLGGSIAQHTTPAPSIVLEHP
jgi:uncharacterized protein YdgA (DUF945 family)